MQYDLGFNLSQRSDAPLRKGALPARKPGHADGQLILPGLGAKRADNVFFALRPPEATALRVDRIAHDIIERHGLLGKPLGPMRYHVSLYGLGIFDGRNPGIKVKAEDAASRFEFVEFPIRFDRAVSFAGKDDRRPLVLVASAENEELFDFHRSLGDAMGWSGLARKVRKAFTPHMTLLYDSRMVPEQEIEQPQWIVQAFCLIHSEQGFSQHKILRSWPMRSRK
jgi:2'-5' RNA ligase